MADDDEIDILGDFSFNSCFAQNDQGIPSCSNREDTVHPQWLLDSTDTNWYDQQTKNAHRLKNGTPRKLLGNNSANKFKHEMHTEWSSTERSLLIKEMAKYGRNVQKISQSLKTKTAAEIQALIEVEYGVNLEPTPICISKEKTDVGVSNVVKEEVVIENNSSIDSVLSMVTTGSPTVNVKHIKNRVFNAKSKNRLQPNIKADNKPEVLINPSEILYEDDLIIGSTESVGSDIDSDVITMNVEKYKVKVKTEKKIGNHRRKIPKNYDKRTRNKSKDILKSPLGRQRRDSGMSDDSGKSPKMQIILGSGQALPLSEGEQVIKIEKKKDSEPESDIDIDIDSDNEGNVKNKVAKGPVRKSASDEAPVAVPLTKFERMPRRQKKIHLDGGGGYTIMHTETGDLYAVGEEPKRERQPRKQPIHLIQCRVYNTEKPAPCSVSLHVSALLAMDWHAHTSRAEVMGLVGGEYGAGTVRLGQYAPAAAAAAATHCDMCPVSQALAAARLARAGLAVAAWHHSHPAFGAAPSRVDLRTQRVLQRALERAARPLLGLVTSQHWPPGRTASHYRCIRVEEDDPTTGEPIGYQLKVGLVADLTVCTVPVLLHELRDVLDLPPADRFRVDMTSDVCPQANITYLEKFMSSARHHLQSAGYGDHDPVVTQLLQGIRDIFR